MATDPGHFCGTCGAALPSSTKFCSQCGARVNAGGASAGCDVVVVETVDSNETPPVAPAESTVEDALDFAITNLWKTFDIVNGRVGYLDGRATAFVGLLTLVGAGITAFTAFILTSNPAGGNVAILRRDPLVYIPFAVTLLSYVGAAIYIAGASRVISTAAPDPFDNAPDRFYPDHPDAFPPKAVLQGRLLSDIWEATVYIDKKVNTPKHELLSRALICLIVSLISAGALSAGVFLKVQSPPQPSTASSTAAPPATPGP